MNRTTVTMISGAGERSVGADVLERSDRRIKVALDGSNEVMVLTKSTPHAKLYTTAKFGMEFETTGD